MTTFRCHHSPNHFHIFLHRDDLFNHSAAKELGLFDQQELVMFVSQEAHYSNMRPGICLGIGMNNVVAIKSDKTGAMCVADLRLRMEEAIEKGRKPFLVVATAGTTVLGAFDPIEPIADLCDEFKCWLHIDAAWGGAVLVSEKHKNLMKGESFTRFLPS